MSCFGSYSNKTLQYIAFKTQLHYNKVLMFCLFLFEMMSEGKGSKANFFLHLSLLSLQPSMTPVLLQVTCLSIIPLSLATQSIPFSIPSLPLHLSLHPAGV